MAAAQVTHSMKIHITDIQYLDKRLGTKFRLYEFVFCEIQNMISVKTDNKG